MTYLKAIKVSLPIFLASDFKKISSKNLEPEMRRNFKIFPNSFDQKFQQSVI
jgi:hypothetical protein